MNMPTIHWETDAEFIDPSQLQGLLFRNSSVDEFLKYTNKHFIVASKGIGKTLLLKCKRHELEHGSKWSHSELGRDADVFFVPSATPYLDFSADFGYLGKKHLGFLADWRNAKLLWQVALQLAILSYYGQRTEEPIAEDLHEAGILDWMQSCVSPDVERNPCQILEQLLGLTISQIQKSVNETRTVVNRVFERRLHSGVCVFIDRLDQALLRYPKEVWIAVQAGLLEAAWDIMRFNHHVKLYCSIRQEAYANYESPNKLAMSGELCFIQYSPYELRELLDTLTSYYEGSGTFSDFVGFSELRNPITHDLEDTFGYVCRHTVSRPRDLVHIASALSPEKSRLSVEKLRGHVNRAADQGIAHALFIENELFLEYLDQKQPREEFLSLIAERPQRR